MADIVLKSSREAAAVNEAVSVIEKVFWFAARVFLAVSLFTVSSGTRRLLVAAAFAATFFVSAGKRLFSSSEFFKNMPRHLQSVICLVAVMSAGVGYGMGVFDSFEEYDIILQFVGGIAGVLIGYYISTALRPPKDKNSYMYCICFSFFSSCTLIVIRKLAQFFIDYYTARNLTKYEFVGDDHWLFRLVGFGKSPYEQRPLFDMNEDFLLGVIGSAVTTLGIYFYIRLSKNQLFLKEKSSLRALFSDFPGRVKAKLISEKAKVDSQTNIFDLLIWWCTRVMMVYAFITMENRAEAVLLGVVSLGTVAISLLHLLFPEKSFLCRINYSLQTYICIMVFISSYCGNYVFLYGILPKYDGFLHFVSGALVVMGGYYVAMTLIKPATRQDSISVAVFSLCAALMVMPIHEMVEFVGDFIWGTANQSFYWGPGENSFFFKVFGYGKADRMIYFLFDTMYDILLAGSSALAAAVWLFIKLEHKRIKNNKKITQDTEIQKVTC